MPRTRKIFGILMLVVLLGAFADFYADAKGAADAENCQHCCLHCCPSRHWGPSSSTVKVMSDAPRQPAFIVLQQKTPYLLLPKSIFHPPKAPHA